MRNFNLIDLDFVSLMPLGCAFELNYTRTLLLRTAVPLLVIGVLVLLALFHERTLKGASRQGARYSTPTRLACCP